MEEPDDSVILSTTPLARYTRSGRAVCAVVVNVRVKVNVSVSVNIVSILFISNALLLLVRHSTDRAAWPTGIAKVIPSKNIAVSIASNIMIIRVEVKGFCVAIISDDTRPVRTDRSIVSDCRTAHDTGSRHKDVMAVNQTGYQITAYVVLCCPCPPAIATIE